jgi:glycosyltransferase involved in cell wall biosynthesis
MTFHNPTLLPQNRRDRDLRSRLRRALQSRMYRRADALIAVSEEVKAALCTIPGVRAERVHVVHSGIDPRPRVGAEERAALARKHAALVASGSPILVSAGRLVESKGHDLVIETLPALVREHPRIALWIAGDGPRKASLAERARELGVGDRVHWLGNRDDLSELFALADVFVTGTRFEGLGLAAAEAQQAGLAVAGFRVSGIRDVVVDGETGVLVADGDVSALGGAIRALLADPARRARLGAAGRVHAARFEIEHARSATEEIYRAVTTR